MEYRTLGRTGVKVSPLCLGCMNFGGATDEDDAIEIIHRALGEGINFLDTANVYNGGRSEEIVGKAIQGRRDDIFLATKVHFRMGDGPNDRGNSRYHIMQQVEASLRRLQTDHIDLYQLHRPDPDTTMEEQLSALNDLVRQGKVRYIGTSTFPAWQMCESLWISDVYGFERFVCDQPPYSIFCRYPERRVFPYLRKHGYGCIPWSPLAGGWLAGKYRRGQDIPEGSRAERGDWDMDTPEAQRKLDAVEKLDELAEELHATLSQMALAWTLTNPAVTSPIIGPRTMEHLEDNLGALDVQFTAEALSRVDEIVPPGENLMGYGTD
jgi:aryl-alcohol dehydrogenase-like predicted oxidoreductase